MMSFSAIKNSSGAAHYFESTDDYYSKEGHRGEWQGEGAKSLGLEGGVDQQDFKLLLDGYLPDGQKIRNSKVSTSDDRKGIDFTLSAPKSVSIQALVNGDERVLRAHDEAVRVTLQQLEKLAVARKREKNISFREHTQNLTIASFRHELSRAQDPQLHTHNIVMNLTQREDGQWRALSNEEMLNNVKVLGAFYRAELAQNMKELGYELRATRKGGWELSHVDDAAIKLFSKRSEEIEQLLIKHGNDRDSVSGKEKQMITLATRPKKTEEDRAFLRSEWERSAKEAQVQYMPNKSIKGMIYKEYGKVKETVVAKFKGIDRQAEAYKERSEEADKSIKYAVDHLTERQGIISKSELLAVAYEHGSIKTTTDEINQALVRAEKNKMIIAELPLYQSARSLAENSEQRAKGLDTEHFKDRSEFEKLSINSWVALTIASRGVSQEEAEKSVKNAIKRGIIVKAEKRYVTSEAKAAEISILSIEKAGRKSIAPIAHQNKVQEMLAASNLNDGQKQAVELIMTTENRFVGIQGIAGSGKSHMLSKTVEEIKNEASKLSPDNAYKVVGLAPYASQNRALQELGMESKTLASFLANKTQQATLDKNTIVFLDESSVVPAKQMEKIMRIVERQNARLVLVGDSKQTQAVEAGKPFEQLQNAGMSQAFLTEIQRQKNAVIKEAVIKAASDKIPEAVRILDKNIVEINNKEIRYQTIAKDYASLPEKARNETLIVAGTNEARLKINALVRENLGIEGGKDIKVLNGVDMTKAQAREARSYTSDMVIVAERNYKNSLQKDGQYQVRNVDIQKNEITVSNQVGEKITFNPSKNTMIRAYEQDQIKLKAGEWVKVTKNDKTLDLRNGERYLVASANDKAVVLKKGNNEVTIPYDNKPLNLQYGYATTVHSAQGLTTNKVMIDADVKSITSNRAVFYVAISRPRNDLTIYTDEKTKLASSMSRVPKKFAALELRDKRNEAYMLGKKLEKANSNVEKFKANLRPESNKNTKQKTPVNVRKQSQEYDL